jgi:hypothetical protein
MTRRVRAKALGKATHPVIPRLKPGVNKSLILSQASVAVAELKGVVSGQGRPVILN